MVNLRLLTFLLYWLKMSGLFFPKPLGIHPLTFGGHPRHLITGSRSIRCILHFQLDLLLNGGFLLLQLLDLTGKLLPLVQQTTQRGQVCIFVTIVNLIQLVDLLGVTSLPFGAGGIWGTT